MSQLEIVLQPLARHLLRDHGLHLANGFQRSKIQIAAVYEGSQPFQQRIRRGAVTRHPPGAYQGIALPAAAMDLVVVFKGIEAHYQRSAGAEGAQAHVDPEYETIGGALTQDLDQLSRQALKILVVGDGAPLSPGFARFRKGEDQVDVGGKIELAGAEFSQRENGQGLRRPVGAFGRTDLRAQILVKALQRALDGRFGEGRGIPHRFCEIGKPATSVPT